MDLDIQHIFHTRFYGSNFVATNSQSWGSDLNQTWEDYHLHFKRGFRIFDALLRFETVALLIQRPKLGQISKYLTLL